MTQLSGRTLRLPVRGARPIFARSILILLATLLIGDHVAFAAQHEDGKRPASRQDLSGVWIGQLSEQMADGRVGHGSLYLRLQQNGTEVSGIAGQSEASASPIENPVLSGKHLKFSTGTKGSVELTVELDADGDAMEGKGHFLRSSDNHAWDVEIKLARKK